MQLGIPTCFQTALASHRERAMPAYQGAQPLPWFARRGGRLRSVGPASPVRALVARGGEPGGRERSSTASHGCVDQRHRAGRDHDRDGQGLLIQIAGEAGWEDAGAQFVSVSPMRRFGEPNEVASLVAFLLSQEAPIHQWRRRAYRRWAVAGILKALRPAAATSIEAGDSHTPQETRCIECYSPSSASRSCRSRSS